MLPSTHFSKRCDVPKNKYWELTALVSYSNKNRKRDPDANTYPKQNDNLQLQCVGQTKYDCKITTQEKKNSNKTFKILVKNICNYLTNQCISCLNWGMDCTKGLQAEPPNQNSKSEIRPDCLDSVLVSVKSLQGKVLIVHVPPQSDPTVCSRDGHEIKHSLQWTSTDSTFSTVLEPNV